jgi:hypothetical protein
MRYQMREEPQVTLPVYHTLTRAQENAQRIRHRQARREGLVDEARAWQEQAIVAYQQAEQAELAGLQRELAGRVAVLTGRALAPEAVSVDRVERSATATVDGTIFRLRAHRLVILRPCTGCGVALVESPEIVTPGDLGYVLSAWDPACSRCPQEDPADYLDYLD